jgi:hypothetical protein
LNFGLNVTAVTRSEKGEPVTDDALYPTVTILMVSDTFWQVYVGDSETVYFEGTPDECLAYVRDGKFGV